MMSSRHATRIWPAYAALVLTTALWGSNPAISRLVMDAVPPVALAWGRWLVVVLALSPFMWSERRRSARRCANAGGRCSPWRCWPGRRRA
ncbi:MAG: EamA family transporter [Betaproteobacteria bacterium]|nr:EamA family transporter [Betaproteobacteria bacterium]